MNQCNLPRTAYGFYLPEAQYVLSLPPQFPALILPSFRVYLLAIALALTTLYKQVMIGLAVLDEVGFSIVRSFLPSSLINNQSLILTICGGDEDDKKKMDFNIGLTAAMSVAILYLLYVHASTFCEEKELITSIPHPPQFLEIKFGKRISFR